MPRRALILDTTYRPLGLISWRKAIALVWLSKAEVLEEYDEILRSPSIEMNVPAVIRLLVYTRTREPKIRFSKRNLYVRDHGECQYCKKKIGYDFSTYDHVVPRYHGGRTNWDNIVLACSRCNKLKGSMTPTQAGLPNVYPKRPTHQLLLQLMMEEMNETPKQWTFWLQGTQ